MTSTAGGRSWASRSAISWSTAPARVPGRRSIASARSPHPGANVSRAAITPDQNWTPSQSVSSNDNHAVGVDDSATHPATSDVLPVPAGATTSVSRLRTTSSTRSSRRERRM